MQTIHTSIFLRDGDLGLNCAEFGSWQRSPKEASPDDVQSRRLGRPETPCGHIEAICAARCPETTLRQDIADVRFLN